MDGDRLSELRYKAWGETRHSLTNAPTNRRYTGQTEEAGVGLYYYGARWYDSALGRFVSPDSIIPGTENPLAWDRYAYVNNSPLNYTDPSGNFAFLATALVGAGIAMGVNYGIQVWGNYQNSRNLSQAMTTNIDVTDIVAAGVGGAVAGLTMGAASAVVGLGITGAAGIALENVIGGAVGNAFGGQAQALVQGTKGNIIDPATGTLNIDIESIASDAQASGFLNSEAIKSDAIIGGLLGIGTGFTSYTMNMEAAGRELYLGAAKYKGTMPPMIRGGISRGIDTALEYLNQSYDNNKTLSTAY